MRNKIIGDGNIIGDNNHLNFNKESPLAKELITLIKELDSKSQENELIEDLRIVQDANERQEKKNASGVRMAKFLKTVAGEAGKVALRKMMDSGVDWMQQIYLLANQV